MTTQYETFSVDLAAKNAFDKQLAQCTMKAVCSGQYVRTSVFIKWLQSKGPYRQHGKQVETSQAYQLLHAAYRKHTDNGILPTSVDALSNNKDQSLLVFSILFEIGLGYIIDRLVRLDKVDRHLPIPLYVLQETFRDLHLANWEKFAALFNDKQWKFCPPQFELGKARDLRGTHILPICRRKPINEQKGGTAKLWQIEVLEEFVGPDLRGIVKNSRYEGTDGLGPRYQFALKVFHEGSRYENEKNAFYALRGHGGIVRHLGEYTQGPKETHLQEQNSSAEDETEQAKTTYNILLEFGECDLAELFIDRAPPILPGEIETFWNNLFDVAYALDRLHNLRTESDEVAHELLGWHGDIKPDNIIIIEEEDKSGILRERFKLADPGFAKFIPKSDQKDTVVLDGGTITYSAPEVYGASGSNPCFQTIDTWSLGCVFSIAATWVVLGSQGIKQYTRLRQKAVARSITELKDKHGTTNLTPGDYFHDSANVLQDVLSWHTILRIAARNTDPMTKKVLDCVDREMLLSDPRKRAATEGICKTLKEITEFAKAAVQCQPPIEESIIQMLQELDQEAPARASSEMLVGPPTVAEALTTSQSRKNRKSKFQDAPPLRTANRSEYLKSELNPSRQYPPSRPPEAYAKDTRNISIHVPDSQDLEISGQLPIDAILEDHLVLDQNHNSISWIARSEDIQPDNSTNSMLAISPSGWQKTAPPRTLSQASKELEAKRQSTILGGKIGLPSMFRAGGWPKKTNKEKDELFTRFFENRDIKFLVDNAATMKEFWTDAISLLEHLVKLCKGQDPDGMDLRFTNGRERVDRSDDPRAFVAAMNKTDAMPRADVQTDIRVKLNEMIGEYLHDASKPSWMNIKPRNVTLIVFTDGRWEGTLDKDQVRRDIIRLVKKIVGLVGEHKQRPVSIEFVQFGKDVGATYRLKALDNNWDFDGIPDIVDTEPFGGDLNKMMLGSFVEAYDANEDDAKDLESSPASPNQQSDLFGSQIPSRASTYQNASTLDAQLDRVATHQLQHDSSVFPRRQTSQSKRASSRHNNSEQNTSPSTSKNSSLFSFRGHRKPTT